MHRINRDDALAVAAGACLGAHLWLHWVLARMLLRLWHEYTAVVAW